MSSRWSVLLTDTDGDVITGQVVELWNAAHSGSALASFTEIGSGEYRVDYGTTGKYAIKVSGSFPAALDGIEIVFDDTVYKALLASTTVGEGASLVGIQDAGARITGTNVEAALTEVPTKVELAATTSGKGASTVGIYDVAARITATTVEGALAEVPTIAELASTAETKGASMIGVWDEEDYYTNDDVENILQEIGAKLEITKWTPIYQSSAIAGPLDADTTSITTKWLKTSGGEVLKAAIPWTQKPGMTQLEIRVECKTTGPTGNIRFLINGTAVGSTLAITWGSFQWRVVTLSLSTIPVAVATARELEVYLNVVTIDGGSLFVKNNFEVRAGS